MKTPNKIFRVVISVFLFGVILARFLRFRLARQLCEPLLSRRKYKRALRRIVWWMRHIPKDQEYPLPSFFDYSVGLDREMLEYQEGQLARFADNRPACISRCFVLSRLIERDDIADVGLQEYQLKFSELVDHLLSLVLHDVASGKSKAMSTSSKSMRNVWSRPRAMRALEDVGSLLDEIEYNWFAISGTFLGIHRENALLSCDNDIDIGVMQSEFDAESFLRAVENNPKLYCVKIESLVKNGPSVFAKLRHTNGIFIDLFVHRTDGDACVHETTIQTWTNSVFTLETRKVEAVEIRVPSDAKKYLTENYGNWQEANDYCDGVLGTPNMTLKCGPATVAFYMSQMLLENSDAEKRRRIMLELLTAQQLLISSDNPDPTLRKQVNWPKVFGRPRG